MGVEEADRAGSALADHVTVALRHRRALVVQEGLAALWHRSWKRNSDFTPLSLQSRQRESSASSREARQASISATRRAVRHLILSRGISKDAKRRLFAYLPLGRCPRPLRSAGRYAESVGGRTRTRVASTVMIAPAPSSRPYFASTTMEMRAWSVVDRLTSRTRPL